MELNSARLSSDYKFELCFDSKIDSIMCDPARIRQILTNLHDNAIKYSPSGGVVRVTTQSYPTEIWISVQDEGIGMNPDETEFIFDRFRQLAEGYTRRAGGLGIGLSIVKKLVELHGGRIWVESKSGKGSVFTFSIPHSPRNLETLAAQEDSNGGNTSGGDKDPWAGLTVLVVDDDESIQMYMKALMSSAGKMINAYDGQEGIELASEEIPDLILMDLRMPVMDGLKAIECLKSQPATKGIPIIVVTAQTYQTDKEHCIELGADGYITKPVDIVKFCEEIKNSLGLYR
jgi:CheY-like chemotaxis protein